MKMDAINAIDVEALRERSSCLEIAALDGVECENVRNVKK